MGSWDVQHTRTDRQMPVNVRRQSRRSHKGSPQQNPRIIWLAASIIARWFLSEIKRSSAHRLIKE